MEINSNLFSRYWRMILQVGIGFKDFSCVLYHPPPTPRKTNEWQAGKSTVNEDVFPVENECQMSCYCIVFSGVPVAQPPTRCCFRSTDEQSWLMNWRFEKTDCGIISVKSRENKRQTIQWLMSPLTKKSKHKKVARWFERYFSSHFGSIFVQNKTTTRLATLKERGVTGRIMTQPITNLKKHKHHKPSRPGFS